MLDHVMTTEEFPDEFSATIFLAGPSPRDSETPSWRPAAVAYLESIGFDGVVFDPEHRGTWSGDYDDRIGWEAEGLSLSDVIVFWVPRELGRMPAFTTNVEFGMWVDSGRVVCGAPPDAPKNRYLAGTAARFDQPWHDGLEAVLDVAARVAAAGSAPRCGPERYVPATVWNSASFTGWLDDLRDAGHRLAGLEFVSQYPAQLGEEPFVWVIKPDIDVAGEGRRKHNEVVIGRADMSSVVAHGPVAADVRDTEIVVVSEFRAAGRQPGGLVVELPGGSSDGWSTPLEDAAAELLEEAGVQVTAARLAPVGARQLASTLLSHRCHLYRVELTAAELDAIRARREPFGHLLDDAEVTYASVRTLRELEAAGVADYSTLGMIYRALNGIGEAQ